MIVRQTELLCGREDVGLVLHGRLNFLKCDKQTQSSSRFDNLGTLHSPLGSIIKIIRRENVQFAVGNEVLCLLHSRALHMRTTSQPDSFRPANRTTIGTRRSR